jgi:hypothetical protein
MTGSASNPNIPSFQLFEGGSCLGLEKLFDSMWPEGQSIRKKIFTVILVTWVPMIILGALQGKALGGTRADSVLFDAGMLARFLVALPVLILAPSRCSSRLRQLVEQFLNAKLVKESEQERFIANMQSTMELRNSRIVDWVLLALAYLHSVAFVAVALMPTAPASWRTAGAEGHQVLSYAGWWWAAVSQPILMFVVLRFVYRLGLWWRFLWETSQLDLQLRASHPDGAGGLGFLGSSLKAFRGFAFAISAIVAGGLANVVLLTAAPVLSYKYSVLAFALLSLTVYIGPLLFFSMMLAETRSRGRLNYSRLSHNQLRQFEQKWIASHEGEAEMLSVQDFSAVIDLMSTVDGALKMKIVPLRRQALQTLIIAVVLPFLPVAALEFPLEEILKQLLKIMM